MIVVPGFITCDERDCKSHATTSLRFVNGVMHIELPAGWTLHRGIVTGAGAGQELHVCPACSAGAERD